MTEVEAHREHLVAQLARERERVDTLQAVVQLAAHCWRCDSFTECSRYCPLGERGQFDVFRQVLKECE